MSDSVSDGFAPDKALFSVTLTPHRALSATGFRIVMALVIVGALIQTVPMVIMGAWPVGWFFGLDVLVLYICFKISFARNNRSEHVVLNRMELLIQRSGWRGDQRQWRFNPFWVRLKTEQDPDYGMQRVLIAERRQEIEIGAFLGPDEKAEFAKALGHALAKARA